MPSTLRFAMVCLALTSLSGCQVIDRIGTALSPSKAQTETTAAAPYGAVSSPENPPIETNVSDNDRIAAARPVDDDPEQFLGLDTLRIDQRLGAPDLIRRDGRAEVRQFRGQACILDLFLYPATDGLAVKHVELRGPSLDNSGRRACLADLIRDRTLEG